MAAKLLIYGTPASGKTSITEPLPNSLTISYDKKEYPFNKPHVYLTKASRDAENRWVGDVTSAKNITDRITNAIVAYKDKYDALPETLVIDAFSTIVGDLGEFMINTASNTQKAWGEFYTATMRIVDYIEMLVRDKGINAIIVSHVYKNGETGAFEDVNQGKFKKSSGLLASVDHAISLEPLDDYTRRVYINAPSRFARTTLKGKPNFVNLADFNIVEFLAEINAQSTTNASFRLD